MFSLHKLEVLKYGGMQDAKLAYDVVLQLALVVLDVDVNRRRVALEEGRI